MLLGTTSTAPGYAATTLIGNPRNQPVNPFTSPFLLPNQRNSYLRTVLAQPGDLPFGLGDHITVPITQLEAQFTSSLTNTVSGLFARVFTLRHVATTLLTGTSGSPSDNTHGDVIGGTTGYLGAGTQTGVFAQRVATSSSTAISASASNSATLSSYSVDVLQLATAEQNVGAQLLSAQSPSLIAAGANTIDVTVNGTTTSVTANVAAGSTNLQALTAVAAAINGSAPGVYATVQTNNDVAQLVVTGMTTGAASAFSLADAAGNAVAVAGVGTATQAAQDALVRINGADQSFATNLVQLDPSSSDPNGRVRLALHAVTQDTATVAVDVALDQEQVLRATQDLVGAVNDLRAFVSNKADMLTKGLLTRINAAMDGLGQQLDAIGIRADSSGTLSIDETAFRQAMSQQPDAVQQTIGGANNFADREVGVANAVLRDSTLAFATRPAPFGQDYGRYLINRGQLDSFLLGGLFVNLKV